MSEVADLDAWMSRFSTLVGAELQRPFIATEFHQKIGAVWMANGRSPEELWNAMKFNKELVVRAADEGRVPSQVEMSTDQASRSKDAKGVNMIFGGLGLAFTVWFCCGGGCSHFFPAKDAQQQVSRYLEPGRVVVLTRDLPYAVTIEDFKELQKLSSATDNVGVAALVLSGRAGVLEPGTSVKIIESDGWGNRVEVRIASGSEAGKLVQAPLESLEMNVFGPRNP